MERSEVNPRAGSLVVPEQALEIPVERSEGDPTGGS